MIPREQDVFDKMLEEKMAGVHNYNFNAREDASGSGSYNFNAAESPGADAGSSAGVQDDGKAGFLMKIMGGV